MGCSSSKTAPSNDGVERQIAEERKEDEHQMMQREVVTVKAINSEEDKAVKPSKTPGSHRRGVTAESYESFATEVGDKAEKKTYKDIEVAQRALNAHSTDATIREDEENDEDEQEEDTLREEPSGTLDKETDSVVRQAIAACFIFNGFSEKEIKAIIANVRTKQLTPATEYSAEDDLQDVYFIVTAGQLSVWCGEDHYTLQKGNAYGELSLLYHTSNKFYVRPETNCTLFVLTRETYKKVIVSSSAKATKENYAFLKRVHMFKNLPEERLYQLAEAVDRSSYDEGEAIVQQGEEGSMFYLIAGPKRTAQVQVMKTYEDGSTVELMRLGVGSYFGEQALLNDAPRAATIQTCTPVQCLTLERSKFKELLGDLEQDMRDQHSKREKRELKKIRSIGGGMTPQTPKNDGDIKKTFSSEQMKRVPSTPTGISPSARKEDATRSPTKVKGLRQDISLDKLQRFNVIGEGAFGNVHLVRHIETGEVFAVKQMQKVKVVETRQKKNVVNEKRIMTLLDHPFILRLHQTLKDKNNLFLVLEYLGGGDMFSVLMNNGGKFAENTTRFYAAIATTVLGYVHKKKILYRDLKPENMVFDHDGYYKFVDFGFAKIVKSKTFTLCGTPEYLAPEIVQGRGHNKGVDYWALGILVFEMLAGYSPFADHKNNDQLQIYKNILRGKLRFPRTIKSGAVQDLINKLLRPNPSERLGCLKGGAEDIKNHKWFEGFDWDKLLRKEITPPLNANIKQPKFDSKRAARPGDFGRGKSYVDDGTGWDEEF